MTADQDIMRHVPAAIEKRALDIHYPDDDENDEDYGSKSARERKPSAKESEMTVVDMDELPPRNLPIMLYVPIPSNPLHYISIEQLPVKVHTELGRRFDNWRSQNATRRECYRGLSTYCDTFIERQFCVCHQLRDFLRLSNTTPQTYEAGGKFSHSADDWCIRERMPCTHIVEMDGGGYALCFVPLPDVLEDGVSWKELGFWVES